MNARAKWGAALIALLLAPMVSVASQQQDDNLEIVSLGEQTAAQICGDVPDSGWNASTSTTATVNVPVGAFFKKLLDLKVAGNAGISGGKYAGPLQEQLLQVRQDTQNCKRAVFERLLQYVQDTQKSKNVPADKQVKLDYVKVRDVQYPKGSAEQFALRWFGLLDRGELSAAYRLQDPSIRAIQSEDDFVRSVKLDYARCFPVVQRVEVRAESTMYTAKQSAFGRDEYVYAFRTTYRDKSAPNGDDSNERIGIVLSNDRGWQVLEYAGGCNPEQSRSDVRPVLPPPPPSGT